MYAFSQCADSCLSINQWKGQTSWWLERSHRELHFIWAARLAQGSKSDAVFLFVCLSVFSNTCYPITKSTVGPFQNKWKTLSSCRITCKIILQMCCFFPRLQYLVVNNDRIPQDTWDVLKQIATVNVFVWAIIVPWFIEGERKKPPACSALIHST